MWCPGVPTRFPSSGLQILQEVVDTSRVVLWDDITGLENAKQILNESVILPSKRPELFTGVAVFQILDSNNSVDPIYLMRVHFLP